MGKGSINKVIQVGNLGVAPEVRYTGAGTAVTNLSLATDESYKDRNTGQMVPRTEWHRIVMFGKIAEIAGQYLGKGSKVYIEGRLQTRKWQDRDGNDRYTTEIVVDINGQMQMLDTRGGSGAQPGGPSNDGGSGAAQSQPGGSGQTPETSPGKGAQDEGLPEPVDDFTDDIPFDLAERATA